MKTISEKITGHLTVTENTTYHNILVESVIIEKGVTARLYGSVDKDITVKSDGIAYLHGNLFGKINNQGGTVYIFKPNGSIELYEPSKQTIH